MEITYSYMTEEDIPGAALLEQQAFSQPWSEKGIRHYLDAGHTLFVVAKDKEKIAGYAAVMCVLDEGNLVSIVTDEEYRRMGIAEELLDIACEKISEQGVTSLNLEVRQSNSAAISLYVKTGFEKIGIRKGFYDKPKEDAILYLKEL